VRRVKLAGFGARFAEAPQVLPLACELLDATAHSADPDVALPIETQGDRSLQKASPILESRKSAAKATWPIRIVTPSKEEFAI
jgi:hypothetical protein